MLEVVNVNKFFKGNASKKTLVLRDINLSFNDKGMIAILGPSGSGKTTLLNIIGGLDIPSKGYIKIDDRTLFARNKKNDKKRRAYFGYVFQDYQVFENETVIENVLHMLDIEGKSFFGSMDKINDALLKVGLSKYKEKKARFLSGGEKQRLALVYLLILTPRIILADEPTANLDSENETIIFDILKELSQTSLVIFTSHNEEKVLKYADSVITISDGEAYTQKTSLNLESRLNKMGKIKDSKNWFWKENRPLSKSKLSLLVIGILASLLLSISMIMLMNTLIIAPKEINKGNNPNLYSFADPLSNDNAPISIQAQEFMNIYDAIKDGVNSFYYYENKESYGNFYLELDSTNSVESHFASLAKTSYKINYFYNQSNIKVIYGKKNINDNEVLIDKCFLEDYLAYVKQIYPDFKLEDFIGKRVNLSSEKKPMFTIAGITDLKSSVIYVSYEKYNDSFFYQNRNSTKIYKFGYDFGLFEKINDESVSKVNIYTNKEGYKYFKESEYNVVGLFDDGKEATMVLASKDDYNYFLSNNYSNLSFRITGINSNKVELYKDEKIIFGVAPLKDYEIVLPDYMKDFMENNKPLSYSFGNLKVVGYYKVENYYEVVGNSYSIVLTNEKTRDYIDLFYEGLGDALPSRSILIDASDIAYVENSLLSKGYRLENLGTYLKAQNDAFLWGMLTSPMVILAICLLLIISLNILYHMDLSRNKVSIAVSRATGLPKSVVIRQFSTIYLADFVLACIMPYLVVLGMVFLFNKQFNLLKVNYAYSLLALLVLFLVLFSTRLLFLLIMLRKNPRTLRAKMKKN